MKSTALQSATLAIVFLTFGMLCFAQDIPANKTITYELITKDADLLGENMVEVQQCTDLLDFASRRIKRNFPNQNLKISDQQTAISVLSTIDSVFTEFGFLYFTNSKDIHFDFLTLAFRADYNPEEYLIDNRYREAYWRTLGKNTCKLIDCDLYCFIYLGLAQMNNLPLSMVELPGHNFIRWNFPDRKSINWEAIQGTYHPEDRTLSCYYRLNENNRSFYLRDWPIAEVYCYYYTLRGATFDYNSKYLNPTKAKRDYETAIRFSSNRAVTFNNLVWLYVVNPDFDSEFNLKRLLGMMDTALGMFDDRNYYDTKAGLYAQANDFKNAIGCLEKGLQVKYDPDDVLDSCKKHMDWFKQGITIREGKKKEKQ